MVTPSIELKPSVDSPESPERVRQKMDESHSWLVPGESEWEVCEQAVDGSTLKVDALRAEDPAPRVAVVALPATLVTCQLFWLETIDEKAVPDLIRMQCERRALLRQNEVWNHRVVRREETRQLVQVLILQKALPARVEVGGAEHFEALAHCLDLPPKSLALWHSLGSVCVGLSDESGLVYFQSLPHQSLSRECLRDLQSLAWLAMAQKWVGEIDLMVLLGPWPLAGINALKETFALPVEERERGRLKLPAVKLELTPPSVQQFRIARRRQQRIKMGALILAAIYAIFLLIQISSGIWTAVGNAGLQSRLNEIMPRVWVMQNTAREMEALNPALDVKTYALELLYRTMQVLPERGVRLTRFEINGDRLEIGGESTTAREAFDFMRNLETSTALDHVKWDNPPQPIPLPNDTTRFSIQGTINGAYHEPEPT